LFQHLSGALANDDAGGHRVASCHTRHNGSICDAKSLDSIDFERAIHHGHRVSAHLRGTGLMPIGHGGISDEVVEGGALQITRHDFAFDEWLECRRVADLAAEFHAGPRGLQIVRVRQEIRFNVNWVKRIRTSQTETSLTFRSCPPSEESPPRIDGRQPKSSRILWTRLCQLTLAYLQVRNIYPRIALPEDSRLGAVVARRERFLVFPDTVKSNVVLKVPSDAWEDVARPGCRSAAIRLHRRHQIA